MDIQKKLIKKRVEYLIGYGDSPKEIIEYFENEAERIIKEFSAFQCEEEYTKLTKDIVKIKELYKSLLLLAKIYKIEKSKYYKNQKLLIVIEEGLKSFSKYFYNKKAVEHTNWWQWEIGIPLVLNDIFILLYDDLDYEIIKENLETSRYFQPDPRYSGNNPVAMHPSGYPFRISTGGNRTDTVKISLLRGILLNDREEIKLALCSLSEVWKYKDGNDLEDKDGFYKDGSFIQHGSIAYTGGYGEVLLTGIGEIFFIIEGTEYEKKVEGIETLYEIILNSFEPFFFQGRFPDMLSGRGITRLNNSDNIIGHRLLNDILLVSSIFSEDKKSEIENIVKREIIKYGKERYLLEEISPFMYHKLNGILKNFDNKYLYNEELKICNRMGRVMKRGKDFAVGIALHSFQVGNYECMNGENTRGWYTGDGAYYLYDENQNEYIDFWNNVDCYYIQGTTEIEMNMEGVDAQRNSETSFVQNKLSGGVSLEKYGVSAMDYTNWNEKLKSKKSWFFTEYGIIFLENNIIGKGNIYSTIINRKFDSFPEIKINEMLYKETKSKLKVKKIEIEKWKYIFPEERELNIEIEKKENCVFVKVWLEHGENPVDAGLVWGLFHNLSKEKENILEGNLQITLSENIHQIETKEYMYHVNWQCENNKEAFCTIERKRDTENRKLYIQ